MDKPRGLLTRLMTSRRFRRWMAVVAMIAGAAGTARFGWWCLELAWLSATPKTPAQLLSIQRLFYFALAEVAASMIVLFCGVIVFFFRADR